ncbi:hypothetical protein L1887_34460 [Cichorium endivia]|nr:hypothetical protein L1887_34460 [Cichorium endivia]
MVVVVAAAMVVVDMVVVVTVVAHITVVPPQGIILGITILGRQLLEYPRVQVDTLRVATMVYHPLIQLSRQLDQEVHQARCIKVGPLTTEVYESLLEAIGFKWLCCCCCITLYDLWFL